MSTFALTRCLCIFLIIFFMCPKGTHLSASIGQRYFRAMGASSHPKFGRAFKSDGFSFHRKPLKQTYNNDNAPPDFDTSKKPLMLIYSTPNRSSKRIYNSNRNNHKKVTTNEANLKYEPSSNERSSSQLTELDRDDYKKKLMLFYQTPKKKKRTSNRVNYNPDSQKNNRLITNEHYIKNAPFAKETTSSQLDSTSIPPKSQEYTSQYESGESELDLGNSTKPLFWTNGPLNLELKTPKPLFELHDDMTIPLKLVQALPLLSSAEQDTRMEPGFDLTPEEIVKFKIWENAEVPYYIDVVSFKDKALRDQIRWTLSEVSSLTKLNFVELPKPPADDETRWVIFINRIGQLTCSDHSIKDLNTTGVQRVVLGYECMSTGRELAEAVLAIAGVPPQHNSPDRDQFIKVNIENVIPGKEYLFEKLNDRDWLFHNTGYDYESAGHFDTHKHSANGKATIEFRPPYSQSTVRELRGLSNNDIWKISMLYNFISTKNKNKEPACSKLFSPGENLNNAIDPYPKKNLPRPKSNKYLGIESAVKPPKDYEVEVEEYSETDEPDGSDGPDNSNDEDMPKNYPCTAPGTCKSSMNDQQYDESSNLEGYEDNDIQGDEGFQYDEKIEDDANKNKLYDKQKLKRTPAPIPEPDPLLYLSDYNTDNEIYERSLKKTAKGSKGFKQGVKMSSK